MKTKLFAGVVAGALYFSLFASPSQALTFHLSFTNVINGGGLVEGRGDSFCWGCFSQFWLG